ncbi:NFACT RNA binding domain-containing protein [Spirulina sp. CS-785/01]|uniref:Rqc2 family fibronectin-binding protein n=1 Tax=Spirulina sp. CS-785/01 TaxID=3021716 RepID=UPI002330F0ED|nr:NFACT RNA binding domain-containing protein [Spirulina sp. CS-785/01]MDB9312628.1 NFACT RNA binding domain-containing protein [Spirulina sp. CS-785/01]
MQSVDLTTLVAVAQDLRSRWIPARTEQIFQRDRYTLAIALRTLQGRDWLTISWHPQAARLCMADPPPKVPDTFTFSDQLRHQLNGLALIAIAQQDPWERVLDLQFAQRPGEDPLWHLYVEIMGKYSNVILTDAQNQIITPAYQVGSKQSSVRTVQTGQPYEPPPPLMGKIPTREETYSDWQERVSLVPGQLQRQLCKIYRGVSPAVVQSLAKGANLDPKQNTETLSEADWRNVFAGWQKWLEILQTGDFTPGWTEKGYTVLPWDCVQPVEDVQDLLRDYYQQQLNQQAFQQLRHQLTQKVSNLLGKARQKAQTFRDRLQQSGEAEDYRSKADLLMAYLHQWQPGMAEITLNDFETGNPIKIPLNPEKNAVQNAQALYKQHQKLKRAKSAVQPLLEDVQREIDYLEQVEASLHQIEDYQNPDDLQTLSEIREELIQQGYLEAHRDSDKNNPESQPYRYPTPSGFEVWIGRNNRQNDELTFRMANEYDLWFHTQEIPGSHVLLRLEPGAVADDADLQYAADLAAYFSRGRQSDQVPVVYTKPKFVYKPKGAKPGIAIYKREQVLWGRSSQAKQHLQKNSEK